MKKYTLLVAVAFSLCLVVGIAWFVFRPVAGAESHVKMPGVAAAEPSQPVGGFGESNRGKVEAVVINRENVQSVVGTLARPSEYQFESEICYFYQSAGAVASQKYLILGWQGGGMTKAETYQLTGGNRRLLESTVLTARNVYVWGASENDIYTGSAGSYKADDIAYMPTYEDIADLPVENILEGALSDDGAVIIIKSNNPVSGYLEEWSVAIDTGMLVSYLCYDRDMLVFSAEITSFGQETVDAQTFLLPTGLMPE